MFALPDEPYDDDVDDIDCYNAWRNCWRISAVVLSLDVLLVASAETIRLDVSGSNLTIDVEDDGPGISDERKQAMLEPFARINDARNMDDTTGFGLGLSIARDRDRPRRRTVAARSATARAHRAHAVADPAAEPPRGLSGERVLGDRLFFKDCDRLEAIVAEPAMPEIGYASLARLNPFRCGDRRTTLCAGVLPRRIADACRHV
jgi:histidine kinase/DNA gyrase B/HSP90-like ATPase